MGEKGEADNALDPLDDMKAAIWLGYRSAGSG